MSNDVIVEQSSAGHKLGQIVGDWFEEYFAFDLLKSVAKELNLYIDCRFVKRKARNGKILWNDYLQISAKAL